MTLLFYSKSVHCLIKPKPILVVCGYRGCGVIYLEKQNEGFILKKKQNIFNLNSMTMLLASNLMSSEH